MTPLLRDLERNLLVETGRRLSRLSFSPQPRAQTFLRSIDGGQVAVHLSFIEHDHDFDVTADVAVRFDAVEDLVHRSNMLLTKKQKGATFTLGAELGNLESGEPYRLIVTSGGDVDQVAEKLIEKIEAVGLPYLEQYSQPEAAYDLLSRDDRDVWVHCPIHAERAKRACALLAVLGRNAEIDALGRQKLSFLQSVSDPGTAVFSRFLKDLAS